MAEVPTKVKVVSAIFGLSGAWAILLGILGIIYGTPILSEIAYVLIASGAINLGIAYALYRGYKWSWVVAVVLTVLSTIVIVVQYFRYGSMDYLSLAMNLVVAVMLIYSADYYGVQIPFAPQRKAAAASIERVEEMKFFRRVV